MLYEAAPTPEDAPGGTLPTAAAGVLHLDIQISKRLEMITLPTVLVLGAGASADYGFPLGRSLLLQICRSLDARKEVGLKKSLLDLGFGRNEIGPFAAELRFSMQPSVDAFLENRPEYMEIGKAALAGCLIPYEDPSRLYHRSNEKPTWYEYLFNQMRASIDEFKSNQISFVTFNYDRSLEYFLYAALESTYGIGEERAVELLSSISIIHVYGQLGLPHYLSENGRTYGSKVTPEAIEKCVTEIKIISDLADETEEFRQAHKLISEAWKLCFLGFGYHRTNVSRLRVPEILTSLDPQHGLLGSAYELAKAERARVQILFLPKEILLGQSNQDALDFIRNYTVLVNARG
jgi:hypothetical protein